MSKRTKHVLKRALAIFVSMAVMFAAIPCYPVHAETIAEETTPSVSITSESVTAGNSTTLYVKASDFESIAGLEMAVHYDANAFDVSHAWTTGLSDEQVNDLNYATDGTVKYSMISVDGVSGSGYLLGINFNTTSETIAGDYPITVTVSDAYDVNFNSLSIGKNSGNITVKERTQTVEDIYFYSQVDKSSVETGEAFTYSLMTGYMSDLSGGNFEFTYDSDALEVVDVSLADALTSKTAVQSINTKTPGYIKVSYATIEAIGASYWDKLIDITFKAKDKAYDSTSIVFSTTELVGEDLAAMSASKLTDNIKIIKPEMAVDNPDFILSWDGNLSSNRTVDVVAKLPADTAIAAGDFVITYDTDQLKCISAKADSAITGNGGYLVTKEDIGNGKVKFSYVTTKPSDKETALLNMTFEAVDQFIGDAKLSVKGTGVVDIDFKDIVIDYPDKTINIGKLDISDKAVSGIDDSYVYTGAAIKPEIAIEGLRANIDYTVTYKNNTNVGKAEVIINGKGNYSGEITKTFQITHADITGVTAESYEAAYDGKAHGITLNGVPEGATVTYATSEDGEYTETPIRLQNVGTKTIYYKVFKDNYNDIYGFATITITAASIEKLDVSGIEESYTYTGSNIEPKVSIEGLVLGTDYEVAYTDNLNVGTATAIITAKGNYIGTIEKKFTIEPASIEDMDVEDLKASYVYTGEALTPKVTLDGLEEGTDYEVVYADNINVGTAKITLTGKGNYTGTLAVTFEITPATLTGISAEGYEGVYDYKEHTIEVAGIPEDATITYATSKYGEYSAEKPSRKNTGTLTVYYKVSKKNYNDFIGFADVVITPATMEDVDIAGYEGVYDGNAHTLAVNGIPEGAEIVYSIHKNGTYTAEAPTITNAGTLTVYYKVTKADYSAVEGSVEIIINPANIKNLDVLGVDETYDCTGNAIDPEVSINGLNKGTDYAVEYSNNTAAGTAIITINGQGNYTGTKIITFEIAHIFSDVLTSDEDSHWYQCICGARDEEKGHVFGEWQVNANKHWRVCECGVISDETGHSFNWVVDKTATKDETGLKHEECDTCKYKRNVGTVIDRLPHAHDMAFVDAIEPTHTEDGNIAYYMCNKCEECFADKDGQLVLSKDDVIIKALGHSYPDGEWSSDADGHWQRCSCGTNSEKATHSYEWVIDTPATEEATGLKHEECIVCGYYRNENTVIDKLEHVHNMARVTPNNATCTSDGNIEYYYCYNCQKNFYDADGQLEILNDDYILPAGHKLSYQGYVAPNCVNWGYKEHYSCSICYAKFLDKEGKKQVKDEDVIIPVTSHEMMNMHDKNQHWEMCKLCFNSSNYEDHIFEWIIEKEATEEAEGSKYQQCTGCEYRTPSEEISKLPHTHKMTKIDAKEATCDEAGSITYYSCDKCHKLFADNLGTSEITIVDTVIDPRGHDYDVTKTEKASTTKNGTRHLKCKVCSAADREDIYKVGTIAFSAPVLVYNGKKKTPGVTVTDSQGNVIDKANYSVTYPAKRTKIGKYKVTVTFKGEYTGKKTAEFVIAPKAPSSASATLYGYDDVKFSWKKSTGASGYAVYYKKATSSKYTRLTRTTKLSIKKGNLSDGIQYKFKVVPYYKSGKTYYESTAYKEVSIYTLKKLNTPVVTKSGSKVKVSWNNISGETGYQISKATKSGKTSIAATYKTTKGTYKTLKAKKGTKYYYKVRAYKQVGKTKIYGPWSKVKAYKR